MNDRATGARTALDPMRSTEGCGSVVGSRYVLDEAIAVGGMGEVWKATDRVLERAVAVKLLRSDLTDSDDFSRRFRSEARLAAGLSHPGIAHVYDYVEDEVDGRRVAFLVMELIDGQPLSEQLARNDPPGLQRTTSILQQTAEALGAAHALGIVHRDVKPGNLLITSNGQVKVTDFGIARAVASAAITEVGKVIGTVRYMSPEQAQGKEATPASDVYALGVVGYEMLAGHTPFVGDNPAAIALAHVMAVPPTLPASVPHELRALIERSLSKLPEQRPQDGAAFASAIAGMVLDPTHLVAAAPAAATRHSTLPMPSGAIPPTAIFDQAATTYIDESSDPGNAFAPHGPRPFGSSLLGDGWLAARRRHRRIAWGAVLAVVAGLLVFAVLNRNDDDIDAPVATAADPDAAAAATEPIAAAADLVTVDPAIYTGLTEAEARTMLAAAGFDVTVTSAGSTPDLAGLVLDVQPNGPIARGSAVTIVLGDGTIPPVTDPPAEDQAGTNGGDGKSNGKGKGKGKD